MIIDEIKKANVEAMKAHDAQKRTAFQMVMSKYKLAEVEKRAKGEEMADADMVAILQKSIKELEEEQVVYQQAGRTESAEETLAQKSALAAFLPKMMAEQEIREIILSLPDKSIGSVMKHFKQNYAGKCDMRTVQDVLKTL